MEFPACDAASHDARPKSECRLAKDWPKDADSRYSSRIIPGMPTGTNPDTESGIWRADDLQGVTQGSSAVELPKLSFDLLLTLLQAAPRFVSNEELMQRVWKGLVVSPETVTQRVKLLRDGLGDDPRQPRYIEGLRGRGYRLIPVVTRQGTGTATALPANTSAALPTRTFAAWIAAAGAVV